MRVLAYSGRNCGSKECITWKIRCECDNRCIKYTHIRLLQYIYARCYIYLKSENLVEILLAVANGIYSSTLVLNDIWYGYMWIHIESKFIAEETYFGSVSPYRIL